MFWQTARRLQGKQVNLAKSIKDKNGVLISNDEDNLGRWGENFKYDLKPVIFI